MPPGPSNVSVLGNEGRIGQRLRGSSDVLAPGAYDASEEEWLLRGTVCASVEGDSWNLVYTSKEDLRQ